jgi:hypothetical protein
MASSFISFGEFGFWANDSFVEAMQLCLINEIEKSQISSIEWLNLFKTELALQSFPMIYGGMSMELDEFLTEDTKKLIVIGLLDKITDRIIIETNYMSGPTLHDFRKRAMQILKETGRMDFKNEQYFLNAVNSTKWIDSSIHEVKNRYAHSFELLKGLIKGQIVTTASSPIDYWN